MYSAAQAASCKNLSTFVEREEKRIEGARKMRMKTSGVRQFCKLHRGRWDQDEEAARQFRFAIEDAASKNLGFGGVGKEDVEF
jgi:hypothetical protein